jgi:gp20 (fragment)
MAKKLTVFQQLDKAITGNWNSNDTMARHVNNYDMSGDNVIYKTADKDNYDKVKLELQQNKYLENRWVKANVDLGVSAFAGLNNVKLMYRDADLMDSFPEVGAALDIVSEESCLPSDTGNIVNVYSKSDRIKSILEDLFTNRLNLQLTAQMVIRGMCKYGNDFMMLDIDHKLGVKGWKRLPVFNVERIENGITNPYSTGYSTVAANNTTTNTDMSTKFVWLDDSQSQVPFRDWQIAHFRLLTNSMYLPYGVSYLNSARRHWRMLSLMEDMMLIYRLERSIERRVYKIFVGAIDDADVPAYVEEIANNFKRTPIIDPMTGQVDLRKNILSVDQDIFIPVRDPSAPTPIDTLSAAQNLTAMDDIKFVQNKVLTALRIPKTFLNFEETAGDGKNLALMDIRFTRTVNRVQQAFLMELTKVASIHLFLLGFSDELTNFSLTMNNPSTQAESLEIDNIEKKITAVRDAVSDPGGGIPVMSQARALKTIMKWSDKDIKENLEEIRLEKGISAELEKTTQIIKRTGLFDTVDRIYGEPGAEYMDDQAQQGGPDGGMGGGPMGGGGDFGGGLDALGSPGGDEMGDIGGEEGSIPTSDMGTDAGAPPGGETPGEESPDSGGTPMESRHLKKPLITENTLKKIKNSNNKKLDMLFEDYLKCIDKKRKKAEEISFERANIYDKSLLINEEFDKMISSLDEMFKNNE